MTPERHSNHVLAASLELVAALAICFAAAAVGSLFPPDDWYAQLVKPRLNPPGWVFGPVWTALYAMMAVAAWRVWRRRRATAPVRLALGLFLVQLLLNAAWSWLFFGLHRPDFSFFDLLLLWVAIAATGLLFWRIDAVAGALLVPYLGWVTFAGYLNLALWLLNR